MYTSPEMLIFIFLDALLAISFALVLPVSLYNITQFNSEIHNNKQFEIEKKIYLISSYVYVSFTIKIILFFLYFYIMDEISQFIPGAMCAIGSHNAYPPSYYLIFLKIIVIFLVFYWTQLHKIDLTYPNPPYTKVKLIFLIILSTLIIVEFLFEIIVLYNIDPNKIVSCCGTLFSEEGPLKMLLGIKPQYLVLIHLCLLFIFSFTFNKPAIYGLISTLFFIVSLTLIITFHSPYIYQEPAHRCPFCLIQKEYFYIGYVIYILLLSGTALGIGRYFMFFFFGIDFKNWTTYSFLMYICYSLILYVVVLRYFLVNGVWLF
ncbi:MAG: hypothetical protein N3C60_07675 [Calditerrivibrio sp.]|nr:hypothetical protein [Calditerrivibrio sp.]